MNPCRVEYRNMHPSLSNVDMEKTCSIFYDFLQAGFPHPRFCCLQGKDFLQTSLSERGLDELLLSSSWSLFLVEPEHCLLYSFLLDLAKYFAMVFLKTAALNPKPIGEFLDFVKDTANFLQKCCNLSAKEKFQNSDLLNRFFI